MGDAVAVAVGGDGAGVPSPRRCLVWVARRVTEWQRPGLRGIAGGVEYGVGAGLDQLAPLIERVAHVAGHRAVRGSDQSGDQPRRLPRAARARRPAGGTRHPVVQYRGDVVSVIEPARGHQTREQDVEVVVVGLGAAQFGGECPERLGFAVVAKARR